jgi:hypothetical protein
LNQIPRFNHRAIPFFHHLELERLDRLPWIEHLPWPARDLDRALEVVLVPLPVLEVSMDRYRYR